MHAQIWEASYPTGVSWSAPLPSPVPLESFLRMAAENWPEKIAIDFYDHTTSYGELYRLARRAAAGLQRLGVGPGVHVGLHLTNTPHYIICFFGILMAGGRVVNYSPLAGARELERQLKDSDTEILITLEEQGIWQRAQALKGMGRLRSLVVCSLADFGGKASDQRPALTGEDRDFATLVGHGGQYIIHPRHDLREEIAVLQYTGGTTGDAKGAMLTHANFSAIVHIHYRWYRGDQPVGSGTPRDSDQILVAMPLVHILGLSCMMLLSVVSGTRMVLHTRFEPNQVLEDIARKKIASFVGAPSMFKALASHSKLKAFDLSSLEYCSSGGAPLPAPTMSKFSNKVGVKLGEGYGLTELAPLGTLHPPGRPPRPGSVGLPLPHTLVEIVDMEDGLTVLPPGVKGEVCFRGPQVMKGYWKREAETKEAFRGDRFHTGDIGFMDQDGFVTLVDRKKDMILTGGYNVFPRNVEDAILEHPGVSEVAVVGLPEPDLGQIAKAFIVPAPDEVAPTYKELRTFLGERLASYELPVAMEICESLPRTPLGKVSKKTLVDDEIARAAAKSNDIKARIQQFARGEG